MSDMVRLCSKCGEFVDEELLASGNHECAGKDPTDELRDRIEVLESKVDALERFITRSTR